MKSQGEQRQVEGLVGRIDGGGVHMAHDDARMAAQVAGGDVRRRDWVDIGDRNLRGRVHFQQLAGQPAMADQFQDLGVGISATSFKARAAR